MTQRTKEIDAQRESLSSQVLKLEDKKNLGRNVSTLIVWKRFRN